MLDYMARTNPLGFVDPALHRADMSETFDCERMEIPGPTKELDMHMRSIDDSEGYKGVPICVQVVGRRLKEEKI